MKNLYYLLLLLAAVGYGQNVASASVSDKLLLESDFKKTDGRMLVSDLPCKITNASAADHVLVSVCCKIQAFKEFGLQKINDMILLANDKTRNTTGGKSYKPSEIKMSYNPEAKSWSLTNLFSVQEENGTVNERLLALDFDAEGKFLLMKRIF